MHALSLLDIQQLKPGQVVFMKQNHREALRCVIDADGDTVTGRDSGPGSIMFSLSEALVRLEDEADLEDWLFWTEAGALASYDQDQADTAAKLATGSPGDILRMLYRNWAHAEDSDVVRAAVRQAMLDAYGVDVEA